MPFSKHNHQPSKLDYRNQGAFAGLPQLGVARTLATRIAKCLITLGNGLASLTELVPRS